MKRTNLRRKGKSITSKLQAKCDKLLSPIIKAQYPICLLNGAIKNERCTYETQVAHHHVHKSKSAILRYNIDNLIPLCNHCHLMLHHNESYWASKIVEIRGVKWFKKLDEEKNKLIQINKAYYEEQLERLDNILNEKQ